MYFGVFWLVGGWGAGGEDYPVNGASNSCHKNLCYFETAGCFYEMEHYYTLHFAFGTWKVRF